MFGLKIMVFEPLEEYPYKITYIITSITLSRPDTKIIGTRTLTLTQRTSYGIVTKFEIFGNILEGYASYNFL